ncbi:3-hydroxyacyl-CoA dehydrogenase [Parageobacillus sp. VR-IP]|jgi:3-hydroxybutyryl-CoA dehydrogenase|uniref:Putative 3-hydroxybutyryl-CoA dehydrogenase n=1 Tax=Parageobacillus caldoxylosilyticus NBRC 107762 TaxID=1220594 RepID=A0A023DGW8_9BACL|nr:MULTISPECIES: 3-hydroxyacyl-CoA dehydrogenase [Parageobacillus]OQP03299.1 3-hydroxybutyryl-CoA dehydrogenase [Geobacillus sp. 44B]MBB3853042.1 3-hydroxybutyryl-CoA dehydrogenase [Parageobacillus caldoxylosilyticus]NUK31564.1 3-hydroxyacyl-CoA dehydrogenase [Parageobacillus sp. VR-IP]QNU36783.1 3-hydroxyacyl-CoA dehydrogenase [Geobacillus sp. 44B]GAJ40256.1 putative 3-hydroxybutyryl-CoA dehydrogenase [Parageobacillus caldoxylosilyticus NBRC 107762]
MIHRIVVVGSGVMGRGIAYVSAVGGFETILVDVKEEQLESAKQEIAAIFVQAVSRGKLTEAERQEAEARLRYFLDLAEAVREADLVIEAVPEKLEVKKQVFETIDKHAPASCYFATNTSTMSPTEIGSFTKRPEKVIAMHFFNPVHKMKLVEIIRGLETSDDTVNVIQHVAEKMGKETVVVNEFPGFVTSRISALIGNEAFYMLQEGVGTPEQIDKAIKLGLNFPMGPFELADLVGLDTRLNNLKYLHEKLGEKYRPAPLLEQYVKAGRLGRKTGKGVYDYTKQGNKGDESC